MTTLVQQEHLFTYDTPEDSDDEVCYASNDAYETSEGPFTSEGTVSDDEEEEDKVAETSLDNLMRNYCTDNKLEVSEHSSSPLIMFTDVSIHSGISLSFHYPHG